MLEKFYWETEGKRLLENRDVNEKMIFKVAVKGKRLKGLDWTHMAHNRHQWKGCCQHTNELSAFIKWWEFPRTAGTLLSFQERVCCLGPL
jgi:hypothetical protein